MRRRARCCDNDVRERHPPRRNRARAPRRRDRRGRRRRDRRGPRPRGARGAPERRGPRPRGAEARAPGAALRAGEPLEIITPKTDGALDVIRHDAAHVLAAAVMELYPGVKISIGPPIANGFYYDFEFPAGVTLSDADFERIEARMREHIKADEPFVRRDVSVEEALERFRG